MTFYTTNNSQPSIPNTELFNRISSSKASISEAQAYLRNLHQFLNDRSTSKDDRNYNTALDQYIFIEQLLDGMGALEPIDSRASEFDVEGAAPIVNRDRLEQTYTKQKSSQEQEADILAAATSKDSELELTKLAAAQNRPFHVVQGLANVLLKAQGLDSQYDLSKANYQRCVEAIRNIELKDDPGEKDWKLYDLARQYGRSKEAMLESYYKSLLVHHLEDPISLKNFVETNTQGRRWTLRGWIPEQSLVLFYGNGGDGKTLFTHHLIKHIAQGIDWGEYKVNGSAGGILYIQTDSALAQAVGALKRAGIPDDVPIQLHSSWRIEFMHYLYKWIQKQRPVLVVIDSLTTVNRYATTNENETKYAQPILQLRDIAAEFNCSFVIIHHANGAGEVRGTKAVRAAVDEVWKIERTTKDESDLKRRLIIEKSRSRAQGRYQLQFNDEDFSWELLEPEDKEGNPTQNSSVRNLIVNHINQHKGVKFCTQELAEIISCSEHTVRKELTGLVREGVIDKERNPNFHGCLGGQAKYFYFINL